MIVKYNINKINIFLFIILYSKIFPTNSRLSFYNSKSSFLSNGNIFIIHKYGVDICNQNLTKIIKSPIIFSNSEQITSEKLSKIIISKYSNGYIISLINDIIYIFDEKGDFLSQNKINGEYNPDYYTLIALSGDSVYNYIIGFIFNNLFYLYYYQYNKSTNQTSILSKNEGFKCNLGLTRKRLNLKNSGVSCHVMDNKNIEEVVTCHYILIDNNNEYFAIGFYIPGEIFGESQKYKPEYHEYKNVKFLKVDVNSSRSIALICLILSDGKNNCFHYDIYKEYNAGLTFTNFNCNNNICKNEYHSLNVDYNFEKDEFVFSCSGNNGNITYCIFDNSFK